VNFLPYRRCLQRTITFMITSIILKFEADVQFARCALNSRVSPFCDVLNWPIDPNVHLGAADPIDRSIA